MAKEPEVIQQEMDETRSALAEKLEQIGTKISGTVETVSETVSGVTEAVTNVTEAVEGTVQNLSDAVSGTVESVKDTVTSVGETASETVEAVKHAFNLPEHIRNNPWVWFGGSVVLGFIGGKIFAPGGRHTREADSFSRGQGYNDGAGAGQPPPAATGNGWSQGNGAAQPAQPAAESTSSSSGSWVGSLFQHFGGEIDKLKGLALGSLFGVARDVVSQSLPEALKDQVVNLFNDVTKKAGGETIQGPVLGESSQEDDAGSHQEAASSKGDEHDPSYSAEMDRPLGAAERKGKAAVGKPHRR